MKAVVLREFGGPEVLRLEDVATPTPAEGQVLIQVHAVSVNRTLDLQVRKDGGNYGVTLPLVLGVDPSGVVVETGPDVERPKVGERVTTFPFYPCGRCPNCRVGKQCELSRMIGVHSWGGYAEYMLAPAANCIPIPDGVDFA
ncbi:MAG TPA: alcohol dehydrogenase catalytic domain-containing protein, partial [Dehalococcoidia bacterium]|nr:alcohol dehydrogenase catalytic domain-containing protein [Dehalococcoidia bacterium]